MAIRTSSLSAPCLVLFLLALVFVPACSPSDTERAGPENLETLVTLEAGTLEGTWSDEADRILAFRGIPYAAPPTGGLRFRPPAAALGWQGVRDASRSGLPCWQHFSEPTSIWTRGEFERSEDCLFLDLFTQAAGSDPRPVMVWFHGGSHTVGHGSSKIFDGTELARLGAVLVSINYRLGSLGFLAHPALAAESEHGSAGNYALLDKIAALEWVQQNIATFGGDPENVTIFGQSAGSMSVCALQASPLAAGLFHRVIGQSASCLRPEASPLSEEAERGFVTGRAFASAVEAEGDDQTIAAALRALSPEQILAAEQTSGWLAGPKTVVDGWVLPKPALEIFLAGEHNRVPTLVGSMSNEGHELFPLDETLERSALESSVKQRFGELSGQVLTAYADDLEQSPGLALREINTDMFMAWGMRNWAQVVTEAGDPAYLYFISHAPPVFRLYLHDSPELPPQAGEPEGDHRSYGAYHSGDLAYVFGNVGKVGLHWTEHDHELASAISRSWVQFARTGDPSVDGLPEWPVYDQTTHPVMEFGESIRATAGIRQEKLDLFSRAIALRP